MPIFAFKGEIKFVNDEKECDDACEYLDNVAKLNAGNWLGFDTEHGESPEVVRRAPRPVGRAREQDNDEA